jgi:hypothetical protein
MMKFIYIFYSLHICSSKAFLSYSTHVPFKMSAYDLSRVQYLYVICFLWTVRGMEGGEKFFRHIPVNFASCGS